MYDFEYRRAVSLEDAAAALAKREDSKVLAGGMSLLPALKQRLARHSTLIDLNAIGALKTIEPGH